jgi:hypothetical protein
MKYTEITFRKPIKVCQIFRNIMVYEKSMKSFDNRKDRIAWKDSYSKAGHIINNELYLPERILNDPNLNNCDLITIEDDNHHDTFTLSNISCTKVKSSNCEPVYNHCLDLTHPKKLDIFELRNNEEFEIYLNYGHFEVGIPERDNFKLCELEKNKPVEIKINGKTDFSLTSRRARVFKEQEYIFEYLGDFNKCKILKEPYNGCLKHLPKDRKVINLLKQLW